VLKFDKMGSIYSADMSVDKFCAFKEKHMRSSGTNVPAIKVILEADGTALLQLESVEKLTLAEGWRQAQVLSACGSNVCTLFAWLAIKMGLAPGTIKINAKGVLVTPSLEELAACQKTLAEYLDRSLLEACAAVKVDARIACFVLGILYPPPEDLTFRQAIASDIPTNCRAPFSHRGCTYATTTRYNTAQLIAISEFCCRPMIIILQPKSGSGCSVFNIGTVDSRDTQFAQNNLDQGIGKIAIMVGYENREEFAANHQWEIVNETTAKKRGPNGEEIHFSFYYHQIPG
jgi:hypothetical protein